MGWLLLLAGIGLWADAHFFKRFAPEQRAALGDKGKGLVALGIFASILLMVIGYRWVDFIPVWSPPSFLTHINNLLILIAFYLMSPAPAKGKFLTHMRHPMLTGFGLWALAHLLVNGDLASIVLFAGLWGWSILEKLVINRAEPDWTAPEGGEIKWNFMGLAGAVILMGVVGMIHGWLGPWPFG